MYKPLAWFYQYIYGYSFGSVVHNRWIRCNTSIDYYYLLLECLIHRFLFGNVDENILLWKGGCILYIYYILFTLYCIKLLVVRVCVYTYVHAYSISVFVNYTFISIQVDSSQHFHGWHNLRTFAIQWTHWNIIGTHISDMLQISVKKEKRMKENKHRV